MPISEHFIIGTIASDYALALVCTAADTDLTMAEHYSRVKLVKNRTIVQFKCKHAHSSVYAAYRQSFPMNRHNREKKRKREEREKKREKKRKTRGKETKVRFFVLLNHAIQTNVKRSVLDYRCTEKSRRKKTY